MMISNMAMEERLGLMAPLTLVCTQTPAKKELVSIDGQMETSIRETGATTKLVLTIAKDHQARDASSGLMESNMLESGIRI